MRSPLVAPLHGTCTGRDYSRLTRSRPSSGKTSKLPWRHKALSQGPTECPTPAGYPALSSLLAGQAGTCFEGPSSNPCCWGERGFSRSPHRGEICRQHSARASWLARCSAAAPDDSAMHRESRLGSLLARPYGDVVLTRVSAWALISWRATHAKCSLAASMLWTQATSRWGAAAG